MTYKTILAVVGIGADDRDIEVAAGLCRELDAHLSVLVFALATSPAMAETAVDAYLWVQQHQPDKDRLKECEEAAARFLMENQLSGDVLSEYPDTAWADEVIARRARYCDLVIAGPGLLASEVVRSRIFEAVLFYSGKPLLLVPAGCNPTLRPKRMLVAWDSSLEASRALREALHMAAAARDVHVVMVDPVVGEFGQGGEPGADVAAYLARHGAKVTVDRLTSSGHPVAEVLARQANDMSADLLVMGAYGHSRLRERIFGGVTKSMLEKPQLPILLAR